MIEIIIGFFKQTTTEFVSALAAVLSALYAFRSNKIAKEALKIAQQDYKSKQADFSLYRIESFRWNEKINEKRRIIFINLRITNNSQSKASFKANLEIEYLISESQISKVTIEHDPSLLEALPDSIVQERKIKTFDSDIRIEEKDAETKWLFFLQPTDAFSSYSVVKYIVKVSDTHGNFQLETIHIIKDLDAVRTD